MKTTTLDQEHWIWEIHPTTRWWILQLRDIWHYRDLLWMFVRRDFVSVYKQTILGPIWFLFNPCSPRRCLPSSLAASPSSLPTACRPCFSTLQASLRGTTPPAQPNLIHLWWPTPEFSGKVYFPRLVTSLSVVISNLIQFAIQFLLFSASSAGSRGKVLPCDRTGA
jgi:lipopolysaccharide transport system permease protein